MELGLKERLTHSPSLRLLARFNHGTKLLNMPFSIKKEKEAQRGPVVVWANRFHFSPGQRIHQARVESRMLLWSIHGRGRVRVDGDWHDLDAEDWLWLPWGRKMEYDASLAKPFSVGAIHVIPSHALNIPVLMRVAHDPSDPLADSASRSDAHWPGLEGVIRGTMAQSEPLRLLATYIVEQFTLEQPEPDLLRQQAQLLRHTLQSSLNRSTPAMPASLRHLITLGDDSTLDWTVGSLARKSHLSPATIHRLFQRFLKKSPARWMAEKKAQKAARLLRTTSHSIQAVGNLLGINDPFHFSRFFKRHHGVSPRTFRNQTANI